LPFRDNGHGRLGEAVARQVDEIARIPGGEEVDFLRAAGGVGGAGEVLAAGERVDERGFPDVGAPREADLDPVGGGETVHPDDALHEIDGSGEEQPAAFRSLGAGRFGEGEGERGHRTSTRSPRATGPPSTTVQKTPRSVWPYSA